MNFLKKMLGAKDKTVITDNNSFWNWFLLHEKSFYETVKSRHNIESNFLNKIMAQLQQLNQQYYCAAGMCDENTAELIITPEGDVKTFVFVEELVAAAPAITGWKFTALKPTVGLDQMSIRMDGYEFDQHKIHFFSNVQEDYPDEIDITLVHPDYKEADEQIFANGALIYLDNALGELNAVTLIDNIEITGACPPDKELIPMEKLEAFLQWREKEFVEKYKGKRYNTENDEYAVIEGQDSKGLPLLAVVNNRLLHWDAKASHPWMMVIEITYKADSSGMPDDDTYSLMTGFEEELIALLPDSAGYLNLGRQTYNGTRKIYYSCHEFRHVSKTTAALLHKYRSELSISYNIYKDKYWKTMNRFTQ
ncbi:DUF695 domain-containing protein [Pseudoflavitalea sp. X16]|uniref:DUF695 domain-containing protein n=1 Tax=Paraflavitalea devenefica TaxID=2716334 RepID=UPI001420E728|nr:DUF695 domain-containing protein [Paraflavitalea devenefica]NII27868.1 DUF695 domain-containing protein [Paraflavitalea devenefica]